MYCARTTVVPIAHRSDVVLMKLDPLTRSGTGPPSARTAVGCTPDTLNSGTYTIDRPLDVKCNPSLDTSKFTGSASTGSCCAVSGATRSVSEYGSTCSCRSSARYSHLALGPSGTAATVRLRSGPSARIACLTSSRSAGSTPFMDAEAFERTLSATVLALRT